MKTIKVLLIDDDQSIYDIIGHYTKKNQQYDINLDWYDDLPNDMNHIAQDFDLLLLDYHINQHTGVQLLQKIESDLQNMTNPFPVIMLSNTQDIQIASDAIHHGITEFIPKGNLNAELINNRINAVIEKNELKKQLAQTNQKLDQSVKELKQQHEEISNFYQLISHELKTPLTSTMEFVDILLDGLGGDLTEEQTDYLTICQRNCNQLNLYINDLLEIGKISTSRYRFNKVNISANEVAGEAVEASQVLAEKKQIKLIFKPAEPDVILRADKQRIYQALLILLSNAIKFSPENSSIQIKNDNNHDTGVLSMSVIDQGCGIAPEHHEKVFERLFQTNAIDVGDQAGLGLGLFICQEIIAHHNGNITLKSALGEGCEFSLHFNYGL